MRSRIFELWFPWTPDTVGFDESEIGKIHNRPLAQIIGKACHEIGWHARQVYFTQRGRFYSTEHDGVENVLFPLSLRRMGRSHSFGHQVSISALWHLATAPLGCVAFFQAHGELPLWGARICEARRIPYLVIIGAWYANYNKPLARYFGNAFRLLGHTQMQLDALEKIGHSNQNMEVFPIGVDTHLFTPKPNEYYDHCKDWPRLLYVGRMYAHKGVFQAVQTFKAIIRHYPNAKLMLIGSRGDESTMNSVIRFIQESNLNDAVTICPPMENRELVRPYQEADLFLYPSTYEGLPQVVLESMACGTPPIVIRGSGGTEEAVIHNKVGWVTDMPLLAYDTLEMLSEPDKLEAMGKRAVEHIRSNYSAQRTQDQLTRILELAVANRSAK